MSAILSSTNAGATTVNTERELTITKPTGTADGDLLLAWIDVRIPIAVVRDSFASTNASSVASFSWSHTLNVGSGNDRVAKVKVTRKTGVAITSITFDGAAMTFLQSFSNVGNVHVDEYEIRDSSLPAVAGTYAVLVTFVSTETKMVGLSVAWKGVDQTNPFTQLFAGQFSPTVAFTRFFGAEAAGRDIYWLCIGIDTNGVTNMTPTFQAVEIIEDATGSSAGDVRSVVGDLVATGGDDAMGFSWGVSLAGVATAGVLNAPPAPVEIIVTPPTGWKLLGNIVGGPGQADTLGEIHYKNARSEPANWKWTWDQDKHATITVGRLTGHNGIEGDVFVLGAAGIHKSGEMELFQDDMLILGHWSVDGAPGTWTAPAGFSEIVDHTTGGAADGLASLLATKVQALKGLTGQHTAVATVSGSGVISLVAIKAVTVTENIVVDGTIKANVLNGINASTAVEVISAEPEKRLSLKSVLITAGAAVNVRLQDGGGKILLPDIIFPASGDGVFQATFTKEAFQTSVGSPIKIFANATTPLGISLEAFIDETS